MTIPTFTGRRRAAALTLVVGLSVALFGAPLAGAQQDPQPTTSTTTPLSEHDAAELKEEYDEILGEEAGLLKELVTAQAARRDAETQLRDIQSQTTEKQLALLQAQEDLTAAEELVTERVAQRRRAEAAVERAEERLRDQIVASYVTGGERPGVLEAFLNADSGREVGQALAYGNAVSSSTDQLVDELDEARADRAKAARQARDAKGDAKAARDEIANAAEFLVSVRDRQAALLDELNAQVFIEISTLRQVQGRKALVEGRINSMNRSSDGIAMILAALQADQPDWAPGVVDATSPLPGVEVSSKFGQRAHPILGITRLHAGADMGAPTGTPIYAPADGTVVLAEVRGGYGNTVVIDHGSSLGTLYGHTSKMLVAPGDSVEQGDVIALVGSTGLSTGPHLHFETRIKGMPIDPEGVVDFDRKVDYGPEAARGGN